MKSHGKPKKKIATKTVVKKKKMKSGKSVLVDVKVKSKKVAKKVAKKVVKEKKLTKTQLKVIEEQKFQQIVLEMIDKSNDYIEIRTVVELKKVLKTFGNIFAVDTETNGLDTRKHKIKIYGISISNVVGKAYWLPKPSKAMYKVLAKKFKTSHLVFANATYDIPVLEAYDMPVYEFTDVLIGIHMVYPNSRPAGLKDTSLKRCTGIGETLEMHKFLGIKKKEITADDFLKLTPTQQRVYGAQDADLTWRLFILPEIKKVKEQQPEIWEIEHSQCRPLVHMKDKGVLVNVELLNEQDEVLEQAFESLNKQINKIAGKEINLRSPQQKSNLLFGDFIITNKENKTGHHNKKLALCDEHGESLVPLVTSDKGRGSTQKKYVHSYRDICPAVDIMLLASSFASLRSNFTKKIPTLVDDDGRLRGSLWSTGASTGRYTSSNPNLQNIATCAAENVPVNIRNAFVASPGWAFVNPDYSQIELRLGGGFANETVWIDAFLKGESPHVATSIAMFGKNYAESDYKKAKNLNFGVLYGQTAYAIAMAYGISEKEAQGFIDKWFKALPNLVRWIDRTKIKCRNLGFAATLYGRRRPLYSETDPHDSIKSDKDYIRERWERRGVNTIIQGTAADIMKIGIRNSYQEINGILKKRGIPCEMLLTVHDELLFHTPLEYVQPVAKTVSEAMVFPINLPIPLAVDVGTGETWSTCTTMRQIEDDDNDFLNDEEDFNDAT